jgi:hypothetical protein
VGSAAPDLAASSSRWRMGPGILLTPSLPHICERQKPWGMHVAILARSFPLSGCGGARCGSRPAPRSVSSVLTAMSLVFPQFGGVQSWEAGAVAVDGGNPFGCRVCHGLWCWPGSSAVWTTWCRRPAWCGGGTVVALTTTATLCGHLSAFAGRNPFPLGHDGGAMGVIPFLKASWWRCSICMHAPGENPRSIWW